MIDKVEALEKEALAALDAAGDLKAVEEVRAKYVGRGDGLITSLTRQIKDQPADQRAAFGARVNQAKLAVEAKIAEKGASFGKQEQAKVLAASAVDVTLPGRLPARGSLHPLTQVTDEILDVFTRMGFGVETGPEVESDFYNFEALNFPEGHPARDMYDTLYVDFGEPGRTLLRTHTSPVQVRVMQEQPPPIYSVMPGRTFRQDTADATHLPVFHQIEGLVVDRGITLTDLAGTIDRFTKAYFGGEFSSRLRPAYFPFTEPSAEFDIIRPDGTFLELGGCGMVHPNVLRNCGIDPEEFTGFAFGFGIERLAVTKAGVDDLRELITNDVRFLRQF
jgi:phenylalanyl-tRNA synthetase alpha chain